MNNEITDLSKKVERLNVLSKQHSDELSKYTYFILAASGASIAYALKAIENITPTYSLIFIALAIIFWLISFVFGIRNLRFFRDHLSLNHNCIINDASGFEMSEALEKLSNKAANSSTSQYAFLIAGAMFYLLFHVVEISEKLGHSVYSLICH